MNMDALRTFLEVVETGSLVAAAKRLNVTPSTVTARINGLEEEIGQKLLHRNKSGADLTSPGFKFRRYAEVMVQLWGQARSEVSLPKGFEGVCTVGLDFDLWNGPGRAFLADVRAHAPGVALAFWPGEQRMLDRWLSIGLVDIAFCYAPQGGERFQSRVLFDDELILVSREPMAGPRLDASYVYVTSALVIASSDWALDHLLMSGGSGYLPRRHARAALAKGALHRVENAPSFTRRAYVVENAQTVRPWAWYGAALAAAASH